MNKWTKKLYTFAKGKVNNLEVKDDNGFIFTLNEVPYEVRWDDDSECVIIIEDGNMEEAHEFSIYDFENMIE